MLSCIDCGNWFTKERFWFPLGSQKMKRCKLCFDVVAIAMWNNTLADIDWEAIEADFYGEAQKPYSKKQ